MRRRVVAAAACACGACVYVARTLHMPNSVQYSPYAPVALGKATPATTHKCSWSDSAWLAPELGTPAATFIDGFLGFIDAAGFAYTLHTGSLLGALRHGGLIPGDRDLDVLLLLPETSSLDELRSVLDARLASAGHPFELTVSDDGHSRWLRFLPWQQADSHGTPVHADVYVYPAARLEANGARQTRTGAAFGSLCRCRFGTRNASCFDQGAREYLRDVYGDIRAVTAQHAEANQLEEDGRWAPRRDAAAAAAS